MSYTKAVMRRRSDGEIFPCRVHMDVIDSIFATSLCASFMLRTKSAEEHRDLLYRVIDVWLAEYLYQLSKELAFGLRDETEVDEALVLALDRGPYAGLDLMIEKYQEIHHKMNTFNNRASLISYLVKERREEYVKHLMNETFTNARITVE